MCAHIDNGLNLASLPSTAYCHDGYAHDCDHGYGMVSLIPKKTRTLKPQPKTKQNTKTTKTTNKNKTLKSKPPKHQNNQQRPNNKRSKHPDPIRSTGLLVFDNQSFVNLVVLLNISIRESCFCRYLRHLLPSPLPLLQNVMEAGQ